MDMMEAMEARHSVRKYIDRPLEHDIVEKLQECINICNAESGLGIVLVQDDPDAFKGLAAKITGFANVPAYFAMIGTEAPDLNEKVGYYGERLVLLSQTLGLNTCWAMACGKKGSRDFLKPGERMVIGIAVGYGATQGTPHKSRSVQSMSNCDESSPEWFKAGVEAALNAPTGMNRQAFSLRLDGNRVVAAKAGGTLSEIDLGIVKLHFELAAGKGNFTWA